MITKENAIPGTEVMYGDHQTVIEPGSYDDPQLGFMLKTARFPGGYPAHNFRFIEEAAETAEALPDQATYDALVTELEGLQLEQSVTGVEKENPNLIIPEKKLEYWGIGTAHYSVPISKSPEPIKAVFDTAIYDITLDQPLPAGARIIITRGQVANMDFQMFVDNQRIQQSAMYISVFKED